LKSPDTSPSIHVGAPRAPPDGDFVLNDYRRHHAYWIKWPKLVRPSKAKESVRSWRGTFESWRTSGMKCVAAARPVLEGKWRRKREAVFASAEKVHAEFARIERV